MKRKKDAVLLGYTLLVTGPLSGCSDIILFNPKGPIGSGELFVIVVAIALMMIVVVPVFVMAYWFARKYKASNPRATYMPKWDYSVKIDLAMWLVPVAIVAALAYLSWTRTHHLDPYKPIHNGEKPLTIEVVSLDWKWLFIYPEQNIAAVNQLVFPAHVPLSFKLTAGTVLTSFFIPQLGSQIYAMPGGQSRLHLLADEEGTFRGHNQQFSGSGYADMHFKAIAASREEFEAWVQQARQSPETLDLPRYEKLAEPGTSHPVTFSSVQPGLFEHVMRKYHHPGPENRDFVLTNPTAGVLEKD